MEVYFGENFWGSGSGKQPGKKITVEKTFSWGEREWRIPAVYVFDKGITVDFCVRVPVEDIIVYLQKWNRDKRESELSDEELEELERDSPFALDFQIHAKVNDKELENMFMCQTAWHPLHIEEAAISDTEEMLMDTYGCGRQYGWSFVRAVFSFPFGQPGDLESMVFRFEKNPVCCPGQHFTTKAGERKRCVELVHPVTKEIYQLSILGCERGELSEETVSRMKGGECHMHIRKIPTHYLILKYVLKPKIFGDRFRIQDCEKPDAPVIGQKLAASAAIIGGASGPVSCFIAGKLHEGEKEEPDVQRIFSALHYKPVERVEWRTSFWMDNREETEVYIKV